MNVWAALAVNNLIAAVIIVEDSPFSLKKKHNVKIIIQTVGVLPLVEIKNIIPFFNNKKFL